jgi:geranylgeranyl diphosphate synthase, type II
VVKQKNQKNCAERAGTVAVAKSVLPRGYAERIICESRGNYPDRHATRPCRYWIGQRCTGKESGLSTAEDRKDFAKALQSQAEQVNAAMARMLAAQEGIQDRLFRAMKYTLDGPGKRLRGALVLWCNELAGGADTDDALTAAVAIEMVHCYSLVHDDLPAMDDDDLRRGRPTCHIAFDEATAVLTGDALLTLAFELLASRVKDAGKAVGLIAELSRAAGPAGMIAGQMADLEGEGAEGSVAMLEYIHTNKTARMFRAACVMGGICAGAKEKTLAALAEYGLKIGLGFQIQDDILDVSASSEDIGKTAGKDAEQGKMTYPAVVGMDESARILERLAADAVTALEGFGPEADVLRKLAVVLNERRK